MDIINDCLLHFKFSLPSELIQERKEKFVSKFSGWHNLFWQFGIDYIELRSFSMYLLYHYATICMVRKDFQNRNSIQKIRQQQLLSVHIC